MFFFQMESDSVQERTAGVPEVVRYPLKSAAAVDSLSMVVMAD